MMRFIPLIVLLAIGCDRPKSETSRTIPQTEQTYMVSTGGGDSLQDAMKATSPAPTAPAVKTASPSAKASVFPQKSSWSVYNSIGKKTTPHNSEKESQ